MWLLLPALIQQWNNYTDLCFSRRAFQAACDRPHCSPLLLRKVVWPLAESVRLLSKQGQVLLLSQGANATLCHMTIKCHTTPENTTEVFYLNEGSFRQYL